MSLRAPISVRIHDAHFGIWQEDARDKSFRSDIYGELIRQMRARGWSVRCDPRVHRHHRILSPNHRLAARGTLRCSIKISGRAVEVDFWSMTARQDNPNGRRYDFDRLVRMGYLDRLRVELEFKRNIAWLETIAWTKADRTVDRTTPPRDRIAKSYEESWHSDKTLGRPVCSSNCNKKTANGELLEHGQTVWFPDRKGRLLRGTAYYNINNMWWVVAGGQLFNESCGRLFTSPPSHLRTKHNERGRRNRLEAELAMAIRRMDFRRAETLKNIIFGNDRVFMIWARDKDAYYCSQYAGYTTDVVSAGKYTRAEAEAECRRVPHELSMVDQDGKHTRFDRAGS